MYLAPAPSTTDIDNVNGMMQSLSPFGQALVDQFLDKVGGATVAYLDNFMNSAALCGYEIDDPDKASVDVASTIEGNIHDAMFCLILLLREADEEFEAAASLVVTCDPDFAVIEDAVMRASAAAQRASDIAGAAHVCSTMCGL